MAAEPNQGATEAAEAAADPINQGATGERPLGESPLSVGSDKDAFDERPEAFVGAAFAGGLALALIVRRLSK
jgi:hypothetical protein